LFKAKKIEGGGEKETERRKHKEVRDSPDG